MSAAYLGSVKDGLLGTATLQPLAVWGVGGTIHETGPCYRPMLTAMRPAIGLHCGLARSLRVPGGARVMLVSA